MKNENNKSSPKDVVLSYVDALNKEDFETARSLVTDEFSFQSPVMSIGSPEEYFASMKQMKIKFNVKKAFADNDDVCVAELLPDGPRGFEPIEAGDFEIHQRPIRLMIGVSLHGFTAV